MRPSVASPTGTVIGAPVSIDLETAGEPVGRVHRDRAHAVVAEVLLHLAHEHALLGAGADPLCLLLAVGRRRATVIAWLISGRRSGKTASITTPWISSMRPTLRFPSELPLVLCGAAVLASIAFRFSSLSLQILKLI